MAKFVDLSGQRFGRLVVISQGSTSIGNNPRTQWNCVCDCGIKRIVGGTNLTRGRAKSCGCLHKEIVGELSTRHGKSNSATYRTWHSMWARCTRKSQASYENYGGRGITVCERWESFKNFYADIGDRPKGMSLDRIDVNGNYEPGNCKWSTKTEQENNKRNNVFVTIGDKTLTYSQWAKELGGDPSVLRNRYLKFGTFDPIVRDRNSYLKKDRRNNEHAS